MRFISHRGNINSTNKESENKPIQIHNVIEKGFDCEVDLWSVNSDLYLGHDGPEYKINSRFIEDHLTFLWIHCKNIEALLWCRKSRINNLNYFWHEEDKVTLTSLGYIWAYPGYQPIEDSIAVMPEKNQETELENCLGICSDIIEIYKMKYGEI